MSPKKKVVSGLRQNLEELANRVHAGEIYDGLEREVRRVGEEILDRAHELELLPLRELSGDKIVREAKRNLGEIVEKIQGSDLLARAKLTARQTKAQVLSILSIPSQNEVVRLSRKITTLEKRVNHLTRKAA
ncbi:MAG: hypothetical protein HYS22_05195 [Deltaproteobacteria bacterium]|nr:hypothetical protein [Deltaproteobacteria bacterium]